MGLEPASVCQSVRASTFSHINISETSRPIQINFHLEHDWGWEKAALVLGPDRNSSLFSMATDSFHMIIMGKNLMTTLAPSMLGSSSSLQETRMSSKFGIL